ncbi:hypothetical protein F8388_007816 [Cannabis sativa]|uniref:Uncharacterized protein n=1 Tax=Cannabis sativa TaxID=3483 RepID=A0A7J6FVY8_CANSA|nr:hypothetical protein F8388_007816 [Cannabis sativa]
MAEERSTGTVRWFNDSKGFGFIKPDDGGEDLFVHQSSIKSDGFRSLSENEAVEFQVVLAEDGKTKAVDVTGPDGSSLQGNKKESFGGGGRRGGRGGGGPGFGGGWRGGDRRNGGGGGGGCYNCGDTGHMARDCDRGNNGGGSGGGGGGCYQCGEFGHMARSCPKGNEGGGGGGGGGSGGAFE